MQLTAKHRFSALRKAGSRKEATSDMDRDTLSLRTL
jgi:hypothetical protein